MEQESPGYESSVIETKTESVNPFDQELGFYKPKNDYFDENDSALDSVREYANFESVRMHANSSKSVKQLAEVLPQVYPPDLIPASIKPEEIPEYGAVSVISKDKHLDEEAQGVFFISGALGTAAGGAHMMAEMMREAHDTGRPVDFSTMISSSTSKDTDAKKYPTQHAERAAQQAAFMFDLLKQRPVKELVLMGHSLGAEEIAYAMPILQKLIEENGMDTKIVGLVLEHPNALAEQTLPQFVKNFLEYNLTFLRHEIAEKYPSLIDIINEEEKLKKSISEDPDGQRTVQVAKTIEDMYSKLHNPPNLSEEEHQKLQQLDSQLFDAYTLSGKNSRQVKELEKQRRKLLQPKLKELLQTADTREGGDSLKSLVRVARATVVRNEGHAFDRLPTAVREKINTDVLILLGEHDSYFPQKRVLDDLEKIKSEGNDSDEGGRYFPNASHVKVGLVPNWAHHTPATNAPQNAEYTLEALRETVNPQSESEIIYL